MKHKTGLIGIIVVLALAVGCAGMGKKSSAQLAEEYTAKAKVYEEQGDMVAALEQYNLVLTVDPENQLAKAKSATIGQELNSKAEEHYQIGLKFYNQGQYREANKEFLTALRYNPDHAEAKNKLTATKEEIEHVSRYIVHILQPDETISTLADKYYGDYRKFHLIAEYNELEDATKVTVGQEIKIPVIEGMPIIADRAAIQTETGEPAESMPGEIITVKGYILHKVQSEETLSKLAQKYYGDFTKYHIIARFNDMKEGVPVRVGQELKIPEVEGLPFMAEGSTKVASIPPPKPAVKEEAQEPPRKVPPKAAAPEKPLTIEDQIANYRELGFELYNKKKYGDAIVEFNKVLKVRPNDAMAREYLGKSHFQNGLVLFGKEDYLGARDEFEASLKHDKDCDKCERNIRKSEDAFKEAHYNKGLAYFGDQKLPEAIVEWESVHELDPNYKDVKKNLEKARSLNERLESIKKSKAKENKN
ncbi:MAG: tetratricopeptide repeat protein [Deltaproteobacteria bacterium]|nr:tetratricopeptide repeat protein [Deltaproteobacteria bacterium]